MSQLPKEKRSTETRRPLRLIAAGLTVVAVGFATWHFVRPKGLQQPPAIDLTGVDPAVAAAIDAARAKVAEDPGSAESWGQLAMILDAYVFADEALLCYAEAERHDSREPRWPYHQALIQMSQSPEAAVPKLRRAVALTGDTPDMPRLRLADLLLLLDEFAEAETLYRQLLEQNSRHARARLGLARLAFRKNEPAESLKHLESCLNNSSTRQTALALRAEISARAGDAAAAERDLAESQRTPSSGPWPDPWVMEVAKLKGGERKRQELAGRLVEERNPREAIRILEELTREYPDHAANWMLLGHATIVAGSPAAAEAPLKKALDLDPNLARAWLYLGTVQHERGDKPAALASFRTAVEKKPDFAIAYFNLGLTLKETDDRPAAIEAFRNALRCQPLLAHAHANLGELLSKTGPADEAKDHLRKAIALNPKDDKSKQLLEKLTIEKP